MCACLRYNNLLLVFNGKMCASRDVNSILGESEPIWWLKSSQELEQTKRFCRDNNKIYLFLAWPQTKLREHELGILVFCCTS